MKKYIKFYIFFSTISVLILLESLFSDKFLVYRLLGKYENINNLLSFDFWLQYFVLTIPISEEIIFRKIIFNFLKNRTKYYNIIQSIIFSFFHLFILDSIKFEVKNKILVFIILFFAGISFGKIKEKTENINICIFFNIYFNFWYDYLGLLVIKYFLIFTEKITKFKIQPIKILVCLMIISSILVIFSFKNIIKIKNNFLKKEKLKISLPKETIYLLLLNSIIGLILYLFITNLLNFKILENLLLKDYVTPYYRPRNNLFVLLGSFIFAPIGEEIIFRKWIFNFLKKKTKYYILIQAILFGLVHGNLYRFIITFFSGIYYGIINKKYKNGLIITIFLHFFSNFSLRYKIFDIPFFYSIVSISRLLKFYGNIYLEYSFAYIVLFIGFFLCLKKIKKEYYKSN